MGKKMVPILHPIRLTMAIGTLVCGVIVTGCISKMVALNSEIPSNIKGDLEGKYVLEKLSVEGSGSIYSSELRDGLFADPILGKVLNGSTTDKQSLPVAVSVTSKKHEANGRIADINNYAALFTLSVWPYVEAEEYEYTVCVDTVTGKHKTTFNVLNRTWKGLSPLAMIPVPGWADKRGENRDITAYHLSQVIAAVRESCADLPKDYKLFLADQPTCLEKIDQDRSESAYQQFEVRKDAKRDASDQIAALSRIVNKTIIANHQNDLINAIKDSDSTEVKLAVLKLLNAEGIANHQNDLIKAIKSSDSEVKLAVLKLLNAEGIANHQEDLIEVFKASNSEVKPAILKLLNDESIAKLPYDPTLVGYWSKITDQRILATVYQKCFAQIPQSERAGFVAKFTDESVLAEMVVPPEQKNGEKAVGLYIEDMAARSLIYGRMAPLQMKTIALEVINQYSPYSWNKENFEELDLAVQMANNVSDKKIGGRIAISLMCKINACDVRGDSKCREYAKKLKMAVKDLVTDDLLEEVINEDDTTVSSVAVLFEDKKRLSTLGFTRIQEAIQGGRESEITKAWDTYGVAVEDDEMLKTLALSNIILRRKAFDRIASGQVKDVILAVRKEELNQELKKCIAKQGELAGFISEIGNGDGLVAWLKVKREQTELQNNEIFSKMKGKVVVLRGEIEDIGQTVLHNKPYVSLRVAKIGSYNTIDVRFIVPDSLKSTVIKWNKGETHVMRGRLDSASSFMESAECENSEVVSREKYNEAMNLKSSIEHVKGQLKEIEEKKVLP